MNFFVQLFIYLVLAVVGQLISAAQQQDKKRVAGVRGTLQTGGDHPLAFIMGLYGTAGHLEYAGTWGNAGETPNAYFTKVISVSDLPVRGLAGFFVNGERVTLLTGEAHPDLGYPVAEYRRDGKDHLWVKFHDGTQTLADDLLIAKFGGDGDWPWEADMIGRGLAYFIATALVNRELFSGLPDYFAEIDGIPLNDPRGGVAQHDNAIVGVDNILRGIGYDGQWVYGPQTIGGNRLPSANWHAQMDKCDAKVAKAGGGTEKRFRFGFEVVCDEEPHAVIGELLKGCEGRIAEIGGVYKVLVGEPDDPVVAISDEDILITEEQSLEPFPGLEATYNGITATYPEPGEAWESKEAPARYRADLEALDDGRRLPFSTEYKAVPFALQVQRLMVAALEETRRFRKHIQTMPPEWWEYEPLDVAAWTSARNGYVAKQFLITAIDDLPNANQLASLQEIEPEDYAWTSDLELPFDIAPLTIARPAPQVMTGWQVLPSVLVDNAGASRRPSIEVRYAGGLQDVRAVRVQVVLAGTADVVFDGEVPYDIDVASPAVVLDGTFLPATDYEARGDYVPFAGRETQWSAWLPVTTPDVRLRSADIGIGAVELENLVENLQNSHGVLMEPGAGSLAERLIGIEERMALQEAALADHMATYKVRTKLLKALNGGVSAAVVREERVRAEEDAALAQLIEEVAVEIAENLTAGGLFQITGEVDGTGEVAKASILMKVRAQVEDAFSEAALQLRAQANGAGGTISDVVIMANRLIFIDDNGNELVAPFQVIDGEVIFQVAYFRTLKSIATFDGVNPIIEINGDTGFFSITIPD